MTDTPNGAIAALAGQLVADQLARDALFTEWLAGSADGGPEGDGRYPLPSPAGVTLVPCWASLTDALTGSAAEAALSAAQAATSATTAAQAAVDLATIQTLLAEARALRAETTALRQDAAAEHAAARAEREACQTIRADMQAMLDAWAASNQ